MATDTDTGLGAFRRFLKKLAKWTENLDYSGMEHAFDGIASVEREVAELKDRVSKLEASRHAPPEVSLSGRRAK